MSFPCSWIFLDRSTPHTQHPLLRPQTLAICPSWAAWDLTLHITRTSGPWNQSRHNFWDGLGPNEICKSHRRSVDSSSICWCMLSVETLSCHWIEEKLNQVAIRRHVWGHHWPKRVVQWWVRFYSVYLRRTILMCDLLFGLRCCWQS